MYDVGIIGKILVRDKIRTKVQLSLCMYACHAIIKLKSSHKFL